MTAYEQYLDGLADWNASEARMVAIVWQKFDAGTITPDIRDRELRMIYDAHKEDCSLPTFDVWILKVDDAMQNAPNLAQKAAGWVSDLTLGYLKGLWPVLLLVLLVWLFTLGPLSQWKYKQRSK